RHRGAHRRRATRGAAAQVSVAGARSERTLQPGEPARHAIVLPEGRPVADAVPARAARDPGVLRFRPAETRAVRGREQGQQAAGVAVGWVEPARTQHLSTSSADFVGSRASALDPTYGKRFL